MLLRLSALSVTEEQYLRLCINEFFERAPNCVHGVCVCSLLSLPFETRRDVRGRLSTRRYQTAVGVQNDNIVSSLLFTPLLLPASSAVDVFPIQTAPYSSFHGRCNSVSIRLHQDSSCLHSVCQPNEKYYTQTPPDIYLDIQGGPKKPAHFHA